MSDTTYAVTIEVTVHDEQALYEAALEHARRDGMDEQTIEEFGLKDEDGNIQPRWCLQMLLDPGVSPAGCTIEQSQVEEIAL